jgi:hypothetical protein
MMPLNTMAFGISDAQFYFTNKASIEIVIISRQNHTVWTEMMVIVPSTIWTRVSYLQY